MFSCFLCALCLCFQDQMHMHQLNSPDSYEPDRYTSVTKAFLCDVCVDAAFVCVVSPVLCGLTLGRCRVR